MPPRPEWPLKIAGLGRYLPRRKVSNREVAQLCGVADDWPERHNGVVERRWADTEGEESATWMGAQAAREALDEAGLEPAQLDLILNASGVPEQAVPDNAPLIQRHLGLGDSGIACFSVQSTCLSFLTALEVAGLYLDTGRHERILVVSADVASVALDFKDPESATLLGDAAAAAVVMRTPPGEASRVHQLAFATYGEGADATTVRGGGSRRHPNSPSTRPVDNLFHMNGREALRLAKRHLPAFLDNLQLGLATHLGDIDLVIPHQPSRAGLAMLKRFGYPSDKVMTTLERLGNCVSASIPSTLYEAVRSGRLQRGDRALLLGTGAGLSLGGAVLTY